MSNTPPNLRFGPGPSDGFTPAGIAAFDDLRPAAVVRELIQNALDAALAGDQSCAVVRFRRSRMRREDLPGIESYKEAFANAIETQRNMGSTLSHQAQLVGNRIQGALDRDELEVLSVLDNGVGLNEQRMNALLSDGLSIKDGGATGTYGNGHSTAIPASDLRYVFYGGITADGDRIGAGHAVIASHFVEGESHLRGADGFFIRDFRAGRGTLYEYATDDEVPALFGQDLDSIQEAGRQGTVVIIPAFNNFLEDASLQDMVFQAASANFFVAIEEEKLKVTVEDDRPGQERKTGILDKFTLQGVLDAHKDQRRTAAFLNGRRAFEAHRAFEIGTPHRIATSAGKIDIRLLEENAANVRIDLCRNGMWIVDAGRLPGFQQKFTDQVPFHAVLSLNASDGKKLHEYLRAAESPLHNSIDLKRLTAEDGRACRNALREIVTWILKNTNKIQSDAYVPPDYLSLDFGDGSDEGANNSGKRRKIFWGPPVAIRGNPSTQLHLFSDDTNPEEKGKLGRNGKGRKDPPPPRTRPGAGQRCQRSSGWPHGLSAPGVVGFSSNAPMAARMLSFVLLSTRHSTQRANVLARTHMLPRFSATCLSTAFQSGTTISLSGKMTSSGFAWVIWLHSQRSRSRSTTDSLVTSRTSQIRLFGLRSFGPSETSRTIRNQRVSGDDFLPDGGGRFWDVQCDPLS